jgi:hypothetical protein
MTELMMTLTFDTDRPLPPQVMAAHLAGIPDKVVASMLHRDERTLRRWREAATAVDPSTVVFHVKPPVVRFSGQTDARLEA